jgi:hypothetical protein
MGGWLAPRRESGERWQAVIRGAGRDEVEQRDLADPGRLIRHRRGKHPAPAAWVSPRRMILADGHQVLASWRLEELFHVHVLDDLTGVVLLTAEPGPDDDDRFPVLLSDIVPWWSKWGGTPPPGFGLRRVDVDWLKFEAVFAAQRDRLDEWTRDLPSRLSLIVSHAQDAPAR